MREDESQDHESGMASGHGDEHAEVNAELRASLGRRLTVAVLEPPGGATGCDELRGGLAAFSEVRVLAETPAERPEYASLRALLGEVARADADALLVWTDAESLAASAGGDGDTQRTWPRRVLGAAEDINLLDACFTAPVGPGVTRQAARKLGYEDGFAAETPPATLVLALLREALVRAQIRRSGSSPPCYL
ncbi:MAG TPA: hypothetical protein VFU88_11450 [Ktedonobacterales bacterium]|nr:hypothetical protein [Ktedonobacterales bacterium]